MIDGGDQAARYWDPSAPSCIKAGSGSFGNTVLKKGWGEALGGWEGPSEVPAAVRHQNTSVCHQGELSCQIHNFVHTALAWGSGEG